MTNDRLRQALQQAALQPDELAEIVQVDHRTVRRWLSGTTPYPRQRAKVARALDTTEHHLWPGATAEVAATPPPAQSADPITPYSALSAVDAPDWKQMMRDAVEHIDLLGETLEQPLTVSGLPGLLAAKAERGCRVRILVSDPGPHLAPYLERDDVGIRVLDGAAPQTIYRFDNQLLLILHLEDQDERQRPLLHIRRAGDGGLFDRLTDHFLIVWEDGSEPIDPDHELHNCDDDDEAEALAEEFQQQVRHDATEQVSTSASKSSPPQRRWPGRPA